MTEDQLEVLGRSDLTSRGRNAQFRPCHLEPQALKGAVEWIEQHRRLWTKRFDQLDRHLRDIQAAMPAERAKTTDG
ncbi:MAG: hypothetical protein WAL04_09595 [Acidimicrobiales bacterium]